MKPIKLMLATIMFAGAPLLLSGCSEEVLPEAKTPKTAQQSMTDGVVYPNSKSFKQTRSASFETDWENFVTYTLPSGKTINLPWSPNTLGKFDYEAAKDIKKADGWTILLHTLNNTADQKQFIIFYNKLLGQLKVFYYHNSQLIPHSNVSWNISFMNPQGWLNSTSEIALPLGYKFANETEYSYETFAIRGEKNSKIEEGWHVFSVPTLAYDETVSSNQILYLSNNALDKYLGTITGSINGDIQGRIITDGSSDPFSDLTKSLSSLSGDAAKEWIEKYCNKKNISSFWSDVLTEGAGGIVKHGVQKILGALLGFSKPAPTVQDVRLTVRNNVSADIKVNKNTISGGANQRFSFTESLIGMKLGVWNLRENPTVYIHPVGVLASAPMGINSDNNYYAFGTSGNYKVDVVINPEIKPYVTSVNVSCDALRFTITDSSKEDYDLPQPLKDFSDYGPLGHKTDNFIKYHLTNPIYNNDFYDIYDNGLRSHAGFYGIWQKYGKYQGRIPIYKYMCATKDKSLCRQQFVYDATYNKVRVTVTIKYNYGGKEYTLTEMRTFTPKFDWDPDLVKEYNSLTINQLQGRADMDRRLSYFDNGTYSELQRSVQ